MRKYDLIVTFPFLRNGGQENIVITTLKELDKNNINFRMITLYVDSSIYKEIREIEKYIIKPPTFIENILANRFLRYMLGIPVYTFFLIKYSYLTEKFLSFGALPTYILSIIKLFNKKFLIFYFECDVKLPNKYQFKYKDIFQRLIQFTNLIFQDFLDLTLLGQVKAMITISEKEYKNAKQLYSNVIQNFYIINPPLSNTNLHLNEENISLNLKKLFSKNKKYLAIIGALDEKKSPFEAMKLLKYLNSKNLDNYELLYVGSGDLEYELKKASKKNNLESKIRFLGKLNYNETNFIFKNIYCNLFFGKYQSWGLTPVEALIFNKPSIVSSNSGSSEFFKRHDLNHIHNIEDEFSCCLKFLEEECPIFKFDSKILKELYPESYIKKLLSVIF